MKRLALCVVLVAAAATGAAVTGARYLDGRGISATRLAAYVDGRQQGHNAAVMLVGDTIQSALHATVAAPPAFPDVSAWPVGAPRSADPVRPASITVGDTAALRRALAAAGPGEVIALRAGSYAIEGDPLPLSRQGRADAPMTLRGPGPAEGGGVAELVVRTVQAMVVDAPYWRVENLTVRGACASDSDCEHAIHVVGGGSHFYAAGNTLLDFNAHLKINGSDGRFPDFGVFERNTLRNDDVRHTANAVTPIDLVAASGWQIRRNLITDFIKGEGDQVSYGAYAKGAGSDNVFAYNVVWCEQRLRGRPGARLGLSFGGGGSGPAYCRDKRCAVEQQGGVMESNVIGACSDDGIYLNNAAATRISNNTVLGTNGLSVRYAGSSADVDGNILDAPLRTREGGLLREGDNVSAPAGWGLLGGRLAGLSDIPRRKPAGRLPADLCGNARGATAAYGAIDKLQACSGSTGR